MKATGFSFALPPFPRHDDETWRPGGTLRDPQQGSHAQLFHFPLGQYLDLYPQAFEALGLRRELHRTKHVGRLVNEVTRKCHAVNHALRVSELLFGYSWLPAQDGELRRFCVRLAVTIVLVLLGLVFVERSRRATGFRRRNLPHPHR